METLAYAYFALKGIGAIIATAFILLGLGLWVVALVSRWLSKRGAA